MGESFFVVADKLKREIYHKQAGKKSEMPQFPSSGREDGNCGTGNAVLPGAAASQFKDRPDP